MDEKVKYSWSQVENQFQRRTDLIPQLVATVSNYASHEKETFEAVTKARSDALDIDVNIDNLDQIQAFYEKQ
jgi:LemA protein